MCFTRIETYPGYVIRYSVDGLRSCGCPLSGCSKQVNIDYDSSSQSWGTYCPDFNSDRQPFTEADSSSVTVNVFLKTSEFVYFSIEFYAVHYGNCYLGEVFCEGCIPKDLACDDSGYYCNSGSNACTDIVANSDYSSNSGVIGGVVTGVIFVVLLLIICCWCHRNNAACGKVFKCFRRDEEGESVAERARQIFSVQLATRGVESNRDGQDNEAYTEDGERIDPSLAEPPPEYNSLENIDQAVKSTANAEDLPPSYDDALANQDKYKVVHETLYI